MIRKLNPSDILSFILIFFPNYKVTFSPYERCFGYYLNDQIVGFIIFSVIFDRAEIDYFAVLEKYRGKGISDKLYSYFENESSECSSISLEVRSDNERAIKFYEKKGFNIKCVRKDYYDVDGYLMVKMR